MEKIETELNSGIAQEVKPLAQKPKTFLKLFEEKLHFVVIKFAQKFKQSKESKGKKKDEKEAIRDKIQRKLDEKAKVPVTVVVEKG